MSDDECYGKSDLEILHEKNLKERNAVLASLMNDPLIADAIKYVKTNAEKNKDSKPKRKQTRRDSSFCFTGAVPNQRRSSARLQNKAPDYSPQDLPDERDVPDPDSLDDLEEVVYQVKKKRSFTRAPAPPVLPVEEVTEEMLQDIQTSGNKKYGPGGTSCHQCRQKTIDQKTVCRSGSCVGIRGQFCGICVINRYGEDPLKALKDPNWKCYVCRGCCNCSFCRLKEGKRPTGILAPLAKMQGYKSVFDFLNSLKGFGDYKEQHENPQNLLGFDGGLAIMGGNKKIDVKSTYDVEEFQNIVKLLL